MPSVSQPMCLEAGIAICLAVALSALGGPSDQRTLVEF